MAQFKQHPTYVRFYTATFNDLSEGFDEEYVLAWLTELEEAEEYEACQGIVDGLRWHKKCIEEKTQKL